MKKNSVLVIILVCILIAVLSRFSESYSPTPIPKFTIALGSPALSDDFLFTTLGEDIQIYKIEGIYQTSGTVTGVVDICDSNGENCTSTRSAMTFNGGLDSYTSFDVVEADSGETLKWRTESVSGSGFLLISVYYWVL